MKPDSSVDKFIDNLLVDVILPKHYELTFYSLAPYFTNVLVTGVVDDLLTVTGNVNKIIRIVDLDFTMRPGHTYVCIYKRRFGHLTVFLDHVEEKQD